MGVVTSDTELANLALTRLGHGQIATLDDGIKSAELCKLHLPIVRAVVLKLHPWNCAVKRAALSREIATPNHEFQYQFLLPVDCLKVIRTGWEADGYPSTAVYGFPGVVGGYQTPIPYRIERGKLLCNETSVNIEYIALVTDVSLYDDLLVDIMAQRLAAEIAYPLTESKTTAEYALGVYKDKIAEARIIDAQEGSPRDVTDYSPWFSARM
jgi:hypothetical protein